MSNEIQPTEAWIQNVRDTFKSSQPVFAEFLKENDELTKWLTIFKYSLELSPESGSEQSKLMLARLDQLLSYMTRSVATLGAMHGLAMMVNAIMSEHEE